MVALHRRHWMNFTNRGSLSPNDDVYFYFRGDLAAELTDEGTSEADASESRFCT